jgi:crotonobetainyl-CoA:carnitine CoA-transferase CaiB-like acyl-CoA transferase
LARGYDAFAAERTPNTDPSKFGIHQRTNGAEPHSRYYRCRDGYWIALNAIQGKHWRAFCDAIHRPDWKSRDRDPALVPELEQIVADAPSAYWEALAAQNEICLTRVIPWQEHLMTSQARTQLALDPLHWAGFAPNTQLLPSPELGSHTRAALLSVGASESEIQSWLESGIIHQASHASAVGKTDTP